MGSSTKSETAIRKLPAPGPPGQVRVRVRRTARTPATAKAATSTAKGFHDSAGAGVPHGDVWKQSGSAQSISPSLSLSIPSLHELKPRKFSCDGGVALGDGVALGVAVAVGVAVRVAVAVAVGVTSGQPDPHVDVGLKCENEHTVSSEGVPKTSEPFWLSQNVAHVAASTIAS